MLREIFFVDPSGIFDGATVVFLLVSFVLILSTKFNLMRSNDVDVRMVLLLPAVLFVYYVFDGNMNTIESLHLIVIITIAILETSREWSPENTFYSALGVSMWLACSTTIILYSVLMHWTFFAVVNLLVLLSLQPQRDIFQINEVILISSFLVGIQMTRFFLSGGFLPEVELIPHEYHLIMIRYLSAPLIALTLYYFTIYWLNRDDEEKKEMPLN